jgi:DNA polymerase III subunit delta'
MKNHLRQWKQIQSAILEQRVPQSMLLVGSLPCALTDFVVQLAPLFFCKQQTHEPCSDCIDCRMLAERIHPEVKWLKPEKNNASIAIDSIRELINSIDITPQRSSYRLIIIEAADRMSTASANALLKSLEEPAKHNIFILIAQQLSTVLPTVLSRCQVIPFSLPEEPYSNNLLLLGEQYPIGSEQSLIVQQAEPILNGLIALLEKREHPCILALKWKQFSLEAVLWFFYLVYSQLQLMHINKEVTLGPATSQLVRLRALLNPILIFKQIDKINFFLKKIHQNINSTLALEDLLFAVMPDEEFRF